MEVEVRYPNLTERLGLSSIPYPAITADHMLAAARQHAKYLKTARPRDYEMRVFPDGSVLFRNVYHMGSVEIISLAQIREKSRVFWRSPHKELWQHVFAMWA
ncbi:hypothetical protein [Tardiphaga robiniae]|uniref:Uncharacterized protein n=1 Tax=Tardiphaga robiniae TaxID=943830 RepID=A0A7G6U2B1_9BRAD|nr:hypothetical protein [Tardiphaga robiniae]QND73143.1 hypothetical protein HB776_19475 [Tardiphaga robiniae]